MFIRKYFLEIKNRVILIIFAWFLLILITYIYKESLLFLFFKPMFNNNNNFILSNYFIFTNVTEVFSVYVKLIFFISNQCVFLFIIYHLWYFLLPGLYLVEKTSILHIFSIITLVWGFSVLILYNIILPASFKFFLSFQGINIYFEAKIYEYLEFYITFYHVWVINSQIISLVICLLLFTNINVLFIKNTRRVLYAIFVLIATLITPPDLFSQLFSIIIFISIYEFLIVLKLIRNTFLMR